MGKKHSAYKYKVQNRDNGIRIVYPDGSYECIPHDVKIVGVKIHREINHKAGMIGHFVEFWLSDDTAVEVSTVSEKTSTRLAEKVMAVAYGTASRLFDAQVEHVEVPETICAGTARQIVARASEYYKDTYAGVPTAVLRCVDRVPRRWALAYRGHTLWIADPDEVDGLGLAAAYLRYLETEWRMSGLLPPTPLPADAKGHRIQIAPIDADTWEVTMTDPTTDWKIRRKCTPEVYSRLIKQHHGTWSAQDDTVIKADVSVIADEAFARMLPYRSSIADCAIVPIPVITGAWNVIRDSIVLARGLTPAIAMALVRQLEDLDAAYNPKTAKQALGEMVAKLNSSEDNHG